MLLCASSTPASSFQAVRSTAGPGDTSRADRKTEQIQGENQQRRDGDSKQQEWPICSAFGSEAPSGEEQAGCAPQCRAVDGGDDGAAPHFRPLLCVQLSEPPGDAVLEAGAQYSGCVPAFSALPVAMGTVASQHQHQQRSWRRVLEVDGPAGREEPECSPGRSQLQTPLLPFACTFCSRRYAHQCQLRIHERVHTGEKPYHCTQCGKSFGQFCSLKRHQMVHTGERPFPCPHCGKQFSTSTNLKVHQSVHTGEKRFHCAKCGKNFSFLSNLIRHQALHAAK